MGYSIDPIAADCYENTTCLINKFNIRDENILARIEAEITFAKASELERKPIEGKFNFEHYKAIHRFLFEDLYDWAGIIRTVNISKKGTNFTKVEDIERVASACFKRLSDNNFFKDFSETDFIKNIVDFYCVTNMLHPFREGNGRTQRVFISQLVRFAGYDIDFSKIDTDDLMIATIKSSGGITDFLEEIFIKAIL